LPTPRTKQQESFSRGNKSPRRPLSSSEAAEDRHGGAIAAWRHDYIKRRIKMLNVRNAAIAVITSASLSLLAMSAAQAQGSEKKPVHKAIYNTTQDAPLVNRPTVPLDGTFHMELAWPEGSPDYHGSNGG